MKKKLAASVVAAVVCGRVALERIKDEGERIK
jgi:hypothetical protein